MLFFNFFFYEIDIFSRTFVKLYCKTFYGKRNYKNYERNKEARASKKIAARKAQPSSFFIFFFSFLMMKPNFPQLESRALKNFARIFRFPSASRAATAASSRLTVLPNNPRSGAHFSDENSLGGPATGAPTTEAPLNDGTIIGARVELRYACLLLAADGRSLAFTAPRALLPT